MSMEKAQKLTRKHVGLENFLCQRNVPLVSLQSSRRVQCDGTLKFFSKIPVWEKLSPEAKMG